MSLHLEAALRTILLKRGSLKITWSSLPSTLNVIEPFHSAPSLLQAHSLIAIVSCFSGHGASRLS